MLFGWRFRPNLSEIIIAALFGYYFPLIQSASGRLLQPYELPQDVRNLISFFIALVITGAVLYVMIAFVSTRLIRISAIRRHIRPTGRFEGVWIERTSIASRPYALLCIYYDQDRNDFFARGWAFDGKSDPAVKADWSANAVHFDVEQRKLLFYSDAQIGTERMSNVGLLDFLLDGSLKGAVCDLYSSQASDAQRRPLVPNSTVPVFGFEIEEMRRLTKDFVRSVLNGRHYVHDKREAVRLFAAWAETDLAHNFRNQRRSSKRSACEAPTHH